MVKHRVPNIVRGGVAVPLNKPNYYLVRGRKHEQGGIDIGKNPRTGLEVEDGEVVHVSDKELRVFSAEPILGGVSPSQLVVRGVNPDKVFAAQERFKQVNGIKDDGTKAPFGTLRKLMFGVNFNDIKTSDGRGYNPAYIERAYSSLKKSGLTKKQQAVVLANIIEESGGDPFALNKNSGKDYGTLQWVDRYPKSNETDPYKEIDNQMGYFLNTVNNLDDQVSWTHGGKGSGYKSRKDAYNDFNSEDIEAINRGFVLGHVRPSGKHASAKNRLGVAEQIYDRIKRLGGNMKHNLVEVNIGGNSKLIRVAKHPSTGKSERSEVRKKAQYGTPGKKYFEDGTVFATNGSILNNKLSIDDKLSKPIIAPPSNKPIYSYANESYLEPIITNPLKLYYDNKELLYPIKKPINPSEAISVDNVKKHIGKAPISPIADKKSFFKSNISDIIGVGSNIIGSLITKRINNKSLDSLTFQKPPVALMPSKLKTKININPQLDKMRESLADYERFISGNTASSRVALGRINRVRSQGIANTNELYGQKENMETQLINTDRARQDDIMFRNLQQDYQYRVSKNAFENDVRKLRAENKVANVQNIVTGVQDLLTRREARFADRQNRLAMLAAYPNVNPRLLKSMGIEGITDEDIRNWEMNYKRG